MYPLFFTTRFSLRERDIDWINYVFWIHTCCHVFKGCLFPSDDDGKSVIMSLIADTESALRLPVPVLRQPLLSSLPSKGKTPSIVGAANFDDAEMQFHERVEILCRSGFHRPYCSDYCWPMDKLDNSCACRCWNNFDHWTCQVASHNSKW